MSAYTGEVLSHPQSKGNTKNTEPFNKPSTVVPSKTVPSKNSSSESPNISLFTTTSAGTPEENLNSPEIDPPRVPNYASSEFTSTLIRALMALAELSFEIKQDSRENALQLGLSNADVIEKQAKEIIKGAVALFTGKMVGAGIQVAGSAYVMYQSGVASRKAKANTNNSRVQAEANGSSVPAGLKGAGTGDSSTAPTTPGTKTKSPLSTRSTNSNEGNDAAPPVDPGKKRKLDDEAKANQTKENKEAQEDKGVRGGAPGDNPDDQEAAIRRAQKAQNNQDINPFDELQTLNPHLNALSSMFNALNLIAGSIGEFIKSHHDAEGRMLEAEATVLQSVTNLTGQYGQDADEALRRVYQITSTFVQQMLQSRKEIANYM